MSADEKNAYEPLDFFYKRGLGYAQEMANRPSTLYTLEDLPVGLAAWMLDHDARSQALIARIFDGATAGPTRDDILDNVTLYWLTSTAVSSARLLRLRAAGGIHRRAPDGLPVAADLAARRVARDVLPRVRCPTFPSDFPQWNSSADCRAQPSLHRYRCQFAIDASIGAPLLPPGSNPWVDRIRTCT